MRRYLTLIVMLFVFCPIVSAKTCDNTEFVSYQEIAKNVTYSYNYNKSTKVFDVTFTNLDSSFRLYNMNNGQYYDVTGEEITIGDFQPGNSYKIKIYTTYFCFEDEELYILYINLPYYNPYYGSELCSGIENYKFCKKFITMSLSKEQIKQRIEEYKKSLVNSDTNDLEENKTNDSFLDILTSINSYVYYAIAILLVIAIIIARWYYNKKNDLF